MQISKKLKRKINITTPTRLKLMFATAPEDLKVFAHENNNFLMIRENPTGEKTLFVNLPRAGVYTITPAPIFLQRENLPLNQYQEIQLPTPDRKPTGRKLFVSENFCPRFTPARMNRFTGEVQVRNDFKKLPNEQRFYILMHEEGHTLYKKEDDCDLYALKKFLNKGFNPSQAIYSLKNNLRNAPENRERIQKIFNQIKNKT